MRNKLLVLFVFSLCSGLLHAQQQYFVQHISQTEGLPQNSINKLAFTKSGFLWLATEDGLVRFDGVNVKVNSLANQSIIKNDRFKTIIKDAADRIYATNASGALFRIQENQVLLNDTFPRLLHLTGLFPAQAHFAQALHTANPFKLAPIPAHVLAMSARYMVAAKYKCIVLFQGSELIDSVPFVHAQLASFFSWNNHSYVFTKSGMIYHLSVTAKNKLAIQPVNAVQPKLPIAASTIPYKVFYKHDQQVFVTHGNHIYRLQFNSGVFSLQLVFQGFNPHEIITDIDVEAERKIIAVGTLTNGIYLLRPNYFSHLRNTLQYQHHITDPHMAFGLLHDSILVTAHKQLFVHGNYVGTIPFAEPISQEVLAIKNEHVLFARGNTIYAYHHAKQRITPFFKTLSTDISVIKYVGDYLFCADATHWYIIKNGHVKATVKHSATPHFRRIHDVLLHRDKYYIATSVGLVVYDMRRKVARSYQPQLDVRSLLFKDETLMLCTYGNGVWAYAKQKFHPLNVDALGLISKAHAILADSLGKFWVSTNNGLFVIHYRDVLHRISDSTFVINYIKYDKQNGLLSAEFNGARNPSALVDKQGNFYFSNMSGIVTFSPYVLSKVYKNVPIYADAIWVNDEPIKPNETTISIQRVEDRNMLKIQLATPYWKNKDNEVLFYQVTGPLSYTGRIALSRPVIAISYLPSGKYKLVVSKSNSLNEQEQHIEFLVVVEKEYYETAWFWIVVVTLLAALLIFAVYLYNWSLLKQKHALETIVAKRTRDLELSNQMLLESESQLRQTVKVKSKLVSIISHDIVTPLKFMSMVTQAAPQTDNEAKEVLGDVQLTTGRLYQNAQNILNWIKYQDTRIMPHYEAVSLFALVQELADLLSQANQVNQNEFVNDIDPDVIVKTDKTIMAIVIQNLLANAAKYVKQSTISVSYAHVQHTHQLTIADTGAGIASSVLQRINQVLQAPTVVADGLIDTDSSSTRLGYIIIAELGKLIDLQVKISSSSQQGTTVVLSWHE